MLRGRYSNQLSLVLEVTAQPLCHKTSDQYRTELIMQMTLNRFSAVALLLSLLLSPLLLVMLPLLLLPQSSSPSLLFTINHTKGIFSFRSCPKIILTKCWLMESVRCQKLVKISQKIGTLFWFTQLGKFGPNAMKLFVISELFPKVLSFYLSLWFLCHMLKHW